MNEQEHTTPYTLFSNPELTNMYTEKQGLLAQKLANKRHYEEGLKTEPDERQRTNIQNALEEVDEYLESLYTELNGMQSELKIRNISLPSLEQREQNGEFANMGQRQVWIRLLKQICRKIKIQFNLPKPAGNSTGMA